MKLINLQDRGDWTSASAAEYDSLCPGRHLAQRGLPDTKNADAEAGDRIHEWLASPASERSKLELPAEELETAEACAAIEEKVIGTWLYAGEELRVEREQRLWVDFGELRHSGKPDVVYVQGERALILDYKTGRNEARMSSANMQLRDLAVLVSSCYGVKEVVVGIVQPWVTHEPELCRYTFHDLAGSMADLEDRVKASNNPKSERVAGEVQCRYCRAKSTCDAFAGASLPAASNNGPVPAAERLVESIQAMSGGRLGQFLGLARLAAETAEKEVRTRLEKGVVVIGWQLKPGRLTEKITNAQAVFERFVLMGGTTEQFMPAVTVTKGKLKDQARAVTGEKGKALEARLSGLIEGATESKQSAPVLERE